MIRTLSESTLALCSPIQGEGGRTVRAFCPFHGSDHQRSLRVDLVTGQFKCFACDAWGYTESALRQWKRDGRQRLTRAHIARRTYFGFKTDPPPVAATHSLPEPQPVSPTVMGEYEGYCKALPGSPAEEYLATRGIPLHMALRYRLGYAAAGKWAHKSPDGWPVRQWKLGRVVFPETNPQGRIVNLYGRAVGEAPKEKAHDHLPGMKGYFNADEIRFDDGPLLIAEGVFDALSLIAAGCLHAVGLIGVHGLRWEWLQNVPELIFAFDADQTGQMRAHELVQAAILRGKTARVLPPALYAGRKDPSEAWQAGLLDIKGWV